MVIFFVKIPNFNFCQKNGCGPATPLRVTHHCLKVLNFLLIISYSMVNEFFNYQTLIIAKKYVWYCHAPKGGQIFLGIFFYFLNNDTKRILISTENNNKPIYIYINSIHYLYNNLKGMVVLEALNLHLTANLHDNANLALAGMARAAPACRLTELFLITYFTLLLCYVPRLAKVVNVLAIRQVKQGTETTGFRIGFTLHSCHYVSS